MLALEARALAQHFIRFVAAPILVLKIAGYRLDSYASSLAWDVAHAGKVWMICWECYLKKDKRKLEQQLF